MTLGDEVVYLDDPLAYGTGVIENVLPNGLLKVSFAQTGTEEVFRPHELELLSVWRDGAGAALAADQASASR